MRKKGLGRGLSSLLPEAEARPQIAQTVPAERLLPNRLQPRTRINESDLNELAESIRAQGILQPIVVTPVDESGRYSIIAGERRWRAAQLAGLAEVPVTVRQVSGDQELLELALVENLQRSDLDPIEEAEAYRQLREQFHLSQEEVALRVGKSRPAVANRGRLLGLPPEVQEMVRSRELTPGQALPLAGLAKQDPERCLQLARLAVTKRLTARQLETLARTAQQEEPGSRAASARGPSSHRQEVHAAAAEEAITRHLQTKVEIRRRRGGGGHVRLHFHSEEELMRLYDLLMAQGGHEDDL